MSIFVYLLIAVSMNGDMWVLDVLPNKIICQNAVLYIQSLDERPAHVYCIKTLVDEL